MAREGKITLYEGTGKASGKPFTALKLEVGDWSKLYFPESRYEMDAIKKMLSEPETPEEVKNRAKNSKDTDFEL